MSTILETLDAREPNEDPHNLASITVGHTRCLECGHVHNDMETRRKVPCPICGMICDCRAAFFDGDERSLLEMIFESYLSKSSRQVCVLLFCTLMELHLRAFLINRCRCLGIDWPIIDLLLDRSPRFEDRLKLFEKICGCSVEEALAGTEVANVFFERRNLHRKRNGLVHGPRNITDYSARAVSEQDIRLAVELATNSFSAFAFLHNKYCSVDAPLLPSPALTQPVKREIAPEI